MPNWLTVGAPVTAQGPAWRGFAGVPFALPEVRQAPFTEAFTQFVEEFQPLSAFVWAEGGGMPLEIFAVVDRNKRRLAAHR